MTEVPCVLADHLSDAQKKAYIIADNRMAMDAGWDEELLRVEIEALEAEDFDPLLTGFDEDELSKLFDDGNDTKDDDFDVDAELEQTAFTKPGDVWTLGRHRLVCGDSTKPETFAVLMESKKANLVITDPPYNVNYEGSAGKIKNDNMANDAFYNFLLEAFKNTEHYIVNPIEHRSVINTGQLTRYLVEGCYPAIIKKEDWLVVQEMVKRIPNKSTSNSEERPFVGMLYCAVCGKAYKIHTTIGMGGHHLRRYRCRSFKDNSGVEVPGMTYVRPHTARYTKNPTQKLIEYREKYVPKPVPRQYLCSDTRVEADYPYKAFVRVWNYLVSCKQRYLVTIYNNTNAEDILLRYNANLMYKLLDRSDRLKEFDTRLFRKTVERIDVFPPDKLTFVFKAGVKVTV